MSRPILLASVALAAYALLTLVVSMVAAVLWRSGVLPRVRTTPALRARHIVRLRALPAGAAALVTLAVVVPAFAIFEPVHSSESVGPLFLTLTAVGAFLLMTSLRTAVQTAMASRRLEQEWLRDATPLDTDPPAGVPAYVIDSVAPIVAVIGVFSPKLVAAQRIVDECSPDELATIVEHERGHWRERDNLKRWLMACAPDPLRWTRVHTEMVALWRDTAEDAADDVASRGEARARLDLAALLIKIGCLGAQPRDEFAAISPFVQPDGLERRVRRLLAEEPAPPASTSTAASPTIAAGVSIVAIAALGSPSALRVAYEIVESVVAFGR